MNGCLGQTLVQRYPCAFSNQLEEFTVKKNILIIAALVVGIAVSFVLVKQSGPKALNVNDVGADPAAFTGTLTVTGIMGGVSQTDPSIFGIMDVKELQCKSANCNKLFIPVKYQGQQPVPGDELRLTGNFVKSTDGYLFMAQSMKVVRNHKIGG